jgi:hypothetical protein
MRRRLLAHLSAPSGQLLLLDGAAAGLFAHGHPPHDLERVDLVIDGPQATEAGLLFGRDGDPRRIHDVPRDEADEVAAAFTALCERHGFAASVAVAHEVEPFRQRLAPLTPPGGIFSLVGHRASLVVGLPVDRRFELVAEEPVEALSEGRWRRVTLEVAPGTSIASTKLLGELTSDSGRLLWGDLDALGGWREDESLDGLGDCLFWGPDALVAAKALEAESLESRTFGWRDLPAGEARRLAKAVARERDERGLRLTLDSRPHSHHYRALMQVRESPLGAGTVEVAGVEVASFATTWGDGAWPVHADLDGEGRLVAVRIELAGEQAPTLH